MIIETRTYHVFAYALNRPSSAVINVRGRGAGNPTDISRPFYRREVWSAVLAEVIQQCIEAATNSHVLALERKKRV